MKVAGIIAEYNPFHNGHLYHMNETRARSGADYIVVVMSGDFVQRGGPAILDKYTRAKMALEAGADLVLELPAAYSTASAEYFAMGAVSTLEALGVIDVLSCGSESVDLPLITSLARFYLHEPYEYSSLLRSLLRSGLSYPQAREQATFSCLNSGSDGFFRPSEKTTKAECQNNSGHAESDQIKSASAEAEFQKLSEHAKSGAEYQMKSTSVETELKKQSGHTESEDEYQMKSASAEAEFKMNSEHSRSDGELARSVRQILSSPNSILALEYQKALLRLNSTTSLQLIQRKGDYHSLPASAEDGSANAEYNGFWQYANRNTGTGSVPAEGYASAAAVRHILLNSSSDCLLEQLPDFVLSALDEVSCFMTCDDFSLNLYYALLKSAAFSGTGAFARSSLELQTYQDISSDLADRIVKQLNSFQSWDSFAEMIKTRQLTRSHTDRALTHVLLNIHNESMERWSDDGFAYYARVLGFRRDSAPLFSAIKKEGRIPLITKMADAADVLSARWSPRSGGNCSPADGTDTLANAMELLNTDIFAADLYESTAAVHYNRQRNDEYQHGLIIL